MSNGSKTGVDRVEEVDPWEITVSNTNERAENFQLAELEDSVAEQGIIQPPLVRESEAEKYTYEVFAGQRRVLAAQGIVDTIPVVVVEGYNDADALAASITENIDTFQQDVTPRDRATALKRLWECLDGDGFPSTGALAEKLGVPEATISRWLEPLREEWDGTVVDPDTDFHGENGPSTDIIEAVDDVGESKLTEIRKATGGGEDGEELVEATVKKGLSRDDIETVAEHIDQGAEVTESVEEVAETHSTTTHEVTLSLSDELYRRLTKRAMERTCSERQVAKQILQESLVDD